MSGIPVLKKKLKGIHATEKLSKALKTVSMAKISRLNILRKNYSAYAEEYRFLVQSDTCDLPDSPPSCAVVMAANRGFCGAFNTELVNFALGELKNGKTDVPLFACGEKAVTLLREQYREPDRCFVWSDTPAFDECAAFFDCVTEAVAEREDGGVLVIYPEYRNTMVQTPRAAALSPKGNAMPDDLLWIPDRESVLTDILQKGFRSILYGMILETALGAQAATLMTMRSAYDTATEYSAALELEIQRKRQSEVTADVIETSAERGSKGDGKNG